MTRIRITALPALLLATASLVACGDDSAPLTPELPITAEPLDSPMLSTLSNSWAASVAMPTKRRGLVEPRSMASSMPSAARP
jgi:hypothetical protein